jgi:putative sterol carrier protein
MTGPEPAGPQAVADWLRRHFRPDAARGLAAVIELQLTGPGGGAVCLQVEDGQLKTSLGRDAAPTLRVVVSAADWDEIAAGSANAELLAVEGRLRLEGDLGLALKLRALFRRDA